MTVQYIIVLFYVYDYDYDYVRGWPHTTDHTALPTSAHIRETWKQQSEEKIEDDEIPHQDGGHEVGDAHDAVQEHAVPHRLYPLPTQHAEYDHETKFTVCVLCFRYTFSFSFQI